MSGEHQGTSSLHSLRLTYPFQDNNNNNYSYNASIPAAYLFSVLFGLSLLLHSFQIFRYKTVFMLVLWFGVGMEFLGYVTRCVP